MFVRVQAEALQSKNSPGSQFAAVALCPQSARPCCSCRGGRAGNARVDRRAQRPQAAAGHCAGVRDAMRPPFGCYNVQVVMLFGLGVSRRGREWQGTRGTGRGDERQTKRAVLNPPLLLAFLGTGARWVGIAPRDGLAAMAASTMATATMRWAMVHPGAITGESARLRRCGFPVRRGRQASSPEAIY